MLQNDKTCDAIAANEKIVHCWKGAIAREAGIQGKVSEKLQSYKDEIEAISEKVQTLAKQKKDRELKLKNVEEPIKKLLDDKLTVQKKLD